ncbi:deoxyribose-phosphate aldolase [Harpegnathos saltator]|uniref:deoxyribose-phosphate aldolase n=1 Tax=Harpegnathos saltator TaxID=610380 RepID=E2B4Z1_HARSA|nr:deoxyribose-phosphate aldolase [Harpegnathos saltator]EFN89199.1 Putative deoxyribose-phosphate aldolase [Harpegnathos saltator]
MTLPFSELHLQVHINEPTINKTVRQIRYKASTLTGNNKVAWLLKAITFIDLTTLNSDDTSSNVEELCRKAARPIAFLPFDKWVEPLHTAAVCVYPSRIADAISALECKNYLDKIRVASVAAGFPSGQYPLASRLEEVRCVLKSGANEVDIVIDRSLALSHEWKQLYEELVAIRKICDEQNKDKIWLKAILATGELFNLKDVYKASMVAMMAGADFIKTSTGKEAINATLPVGVVMCRAVKDFADLTGKMIGIKPAGGIKTAQDALEWMVLIKEELGSAWLNKTNFRIGASSLLGNIEKEIFNSYQPNDD